MGHILNVKHYLNERTTDNNTFEEFEKKTYNEFLFATQLTKGKLKGISVK
jgi:hypothetical protein